MKNRWSIAIAGVLLQVALGAVYAWSVFRTPLTTQFGWSVSQVTFTFTISIFVLGIAAFFGGLWLNRKGPRIVAVTGGFLYGLGVFLASFADHRLWWLYLTYGVIGGAGAGLSYIVPVAVLVKWFPDRRGLITGVGCRRIWSRSTGDSPSGHTPYSECGRSSNIRLPRRRTSHGDSGHRLFRAESTRGLEAAGMDANASAGFPAFQPRLHTRGGAQNLAMVGAVAAAVLEYLRWDFGDLAGISIVPGTGQSKRGGGGQHGRSG